MQVLEECSPTLQNHLGGGVGLLEAVVHALAVHQWLVPFSLHGPVKSYPAWKGQCCGQKICGRSAVAPSRIILAAE